MRITIPNSSPSSRQESVWSSSSRRIRGLLVVFALVFGLCTNEINAQSTPDTTSPSTLESTTRLKTVHHRKHPSVAAAQPAPVATAVLSVAPAEPVAPHWPLKEKPSPATITWDSHGLRIEADNSSLAQLLDEVAAVTGAQVEGMGGDQRIFGAYGPGLTRDVLSQLLQGSGYNVLMVGDQGQGTPRQIVLSSKDGAAIPGSAAKSAASDDDDADADEPQQATPPPPARPNPSIPSHNPQQMMQDMQQRQQQMQPRNAPQN
jgi:hypothetical protein